MDNRPEPGKTYRFTHRTKGVFTSRFLGFEKGDEADPEFWCVQVPTGPGSGQERMANAMVRDDAGKKVTPERSTKRLRPRHIISVEEVT